MFEAQPNGVKDSNSEDAVHAKELRENEMSIDALIEALVDHEFYCVSYSTIEVLCGRLRSSTFQCLLEKKSNIYCLFGASPW